MLTGPDWGMNPDGRLLETQTSVCRKLRAHFNEAQQWNCPRSGGRLVLPLTDELRTRSSVKVADDAGPRRSARIVRSLRRVINLFEQAELFDESGHAFVNIMRSLQGDDAGAYYRKQAMLEWTGATNAADLDIRISSEAAREKQERLARAFEAYLREGKAPRQAAVCFQSGVAERSIEPDAAQRHDGRRDPHRLRQDARDRRRDR